MKKTFFSFLVVLTLGLSGCIKPGDSIENYNSVPAIVELSWEILQYTLKTPYGAIYSAEIQNATDLYEGDMLLTSFSVNYDQQTHENYTIASNLQYVKLMTGYAESTEGGESTSNDFDLAISNFGIYGRIGYYWFFGFDHKTATENDKFIYEMTYDNEQTDGTPVVKIRAKKDGEGSKYAVWVFNMSSFYWTYKDDNNVAKFNIQLKTGVDDDGNDIYEYCRDSYGIVTFEMKIE